MSKQKTNKISLYLWVTPERAAAICGRLYGCGEMSKEKYNAYMQKIDAEKFAIEESRRIKLQKKLKTMTKSLENPRVFYDSTK